MQKLLDDDRQRLATMAQAERRRVREHYTVTRLAHDIRRLYVECLA